MVEFGNKQYQTEKQIRDLGDNDLRGLIFTLTQRIAELEEMNQSLSNRVESLENENQKHEENHKRSEMDKVRHSVIIKGLPYHKDSKDGHETRRQTQETVSKLLATLEAGTEVGVKDSVRFTQNDDHKDKPALVRLTVSTSKQKAKLYESLTKSSKKANYKKNYAKLSVNDEVPSYLRSKQIQLEKQAYELRKKDKSIRTRVFLKGTDIVLKVKEKGEQMFKEWREDEEESEENAAETDEDKPQQKKKASKEAPKEKETPKNTQRKAAERGRGGGRGLTRSSKSS